MIWRACNKAMFRQLEAWATSWMPPGLMSGVPGRGALDAAWPSECASGLLAAGAVGWPSWRRASST
eukprot:9533142-Alexandrium_andersonii.AAC.1